MYEIPAGANSFVRRVFRAKSPRWAAMRQSHQQSLVHLRQTQCH